MQIIKPNILMHWLKNYLLLSIWQITVYLQCICNYNVFIHTVNKLKPNRKPLQKMQIITRRILSKSKFYIKIVFLLKLQFQVLMYKLKLRSYQYKSNTVVKMWNIMRSFLIPLLNLKRVYFRCNNYFYFNCSNNFIILISNLI